MKITRKQIRQLMRESLVERGIIVCEQSQTFVPEPEITEPVVADIDRDELVDQIASTLWKDALFSMAEEGFSEGWIPDSESHEGIVTEFEDRIPPEVQREAGDFLNALEGHAGRSIDEIAAELKTQDLEALGYYIAMQMIGHGVAWSDSREGSLDTPYKESIEAPIAAEDALKSVYGDSTPDDWDLNR